MIETLTNVARRLFGDANEREIKKIRHFIPRINDLEPAFEKLSNEEIAAKTAEFRQRLANGAALDDLIPEAFATVREATKRTMGMRHYDCQLIGGLMLHRGKIAEMKTGEGKTLVATTACYLNALEGKGVHIVTVNDYLAQRDADWMRPIYTALGMTVGSILSTERSDQAKRAAYQCDITYCTNNELGFDYLRDNMKESIDALVQRGHHFAIVDEVDSILIDEARTPLIISGPTEATVELYSMTDAVIPLLQTEIDFVVDEKAKSVSLTEAGIHKVEKKLAIENLYDPSSMEVLHHVSQSLKAHHLFKRDRDYVLRDGKVVIVDEFTGRLMTGRRWSDGLHQAVEAKEKTEIEPETQVYATITFQNLFRMYKKLSGMTGTAQTEAAEFAQIYNLDTVAIPTNRPVQRKDSDDIVYKTQMEKFRAVVNEIKLSHAKGQPVLVGTTSVEKSEIVSRLLQRENIPHEVLNAKNHGREALIVANAGRKGAVTISTNMAGRGTDIKLGGNAEAMARLEFDPETQPEEYLQSLARHEAEVKAAAEEVKACGGLHIIGTERHESRRVDNQLRGRSGRQGDPGSSRFYLSLEDDLMRIFGSDKITVWMERMGLKDDEPIEHRWITSAVEGAQKKVEAHNFNIRKNLLEYDDVMNYQRKGVYELRRKALYSEGIQQMIEDSRQSVVQDVLDDFVGDGLNPENWNLKAMRENLERVFGLVWSETDEQIRGLSREEVRQRIEVESKGKISAVIEALGGEGFEDFARSSVLTHTDSLWKDHLLALDRLRQGIGLRGYGQRNPLLEYKREALQYFLMMSAMRDELVLTDIAKADLEQLKQFSGMGVRFRKMARGGPQIVRPRAAPPAPRPGTQTDVLPGDPGAAAPLPLAIPAAAQPAATAPAAPPRLPARGEEARAVAAQLGLRRNDPCPCGSGLKYKKCCGAAEGESPSV